MNRANVWRKPITNNVAKPPTGFKTIIRHARQGYAWALMADTEVVASGTGRTQHECRDRAREAKGRL